MDLSRRLAAGELPELFSARLRSSRDKKARIFRFRHVAAAVLEQATPAQRALLDTYNAAAGTLRLRVCTAVPGSIGSLARRPNREREEDTILVSYAMWWDLQYGEFGA